MAISSKISDPPSPVQGAVHNARRRCDSAPIHGLGSIQPHGILLLFDAASGILRHRAGDCGGLLGLAPEDMPTARDLLGISIDDLIVSCLLNLNDEAVYVGLMRPGERKPLAMMAHRTGRFVAVELLEAELEGSVASALDMAGTIYARINARHSLSDACVIAVDQVRAITGFDRVMIYRFNDDCSGAVIAQSRAAHATSYLGHRFPESDIPRPARELYRRSLIRMIPDVAYRPALIEPEPAMAIDMSHCILRSVAPVHIEYLAHLGIGASMSVSLLVDGELWGLIVCHHYAPRTVPVEAQLFCRHVATSLSAFVLNFERAENARLGAMQTAALDRVLETMHRSEDPERRLRTSGEELKQLFECDGFVLLDEGEVIAAAGRFPGVGKLRELSPLTEAKLIGRQSYATDRLGEEFADAPAISGEASGILAVSLHAWRPLTALWLRPEQVETIDWAGSPGADDGHDALPPSPERSFASWRQTVCGRSRPWTRREIEAVEMFRARVGYAMQRHRLERANAELAAANVLLSEQATTDPLTGLANRRLFDDRLRREWSRARREDHPIALISIDIDHFKEYNDHFGHPAGDECLKNVALTINETCRNIGVAARMGGEEFALLLPGFDASEAAVVAERVRDIVEELCVEHPDPDCRVVTISLGVAATSPARCNDAIALISAADRALYQAKASGRNAVKVDTEG